MPAERPSGGPDRPGAGRTAPKAGTAGTTRYMGTAAAILAELMTVPEADRLDVLAVTVRAALDLEVVHV